jgi:hypothetical protein
MRATSGAPWPASRYGHSLIDEVHGHASILERPSRMLELQTPLQAIVVRESRVAVRQTDFVSRRVSNL